MSRVLVALQFALIGALAWPAPDDTRRSAAALALLGVAILVGVAALAANRPGNFNIRPDVKPGAKLATSGPYRYVRHPMYVAVILFGLACVASGATPRRIAALAALAAVLHVKALREERAMRAAHAGYDAYCARTARYLPGVF